MSLFTPYASIDEVWSSASIAPQLLNPYSDPLYQQNVLKKLNSEAVIERPSQHTVKSFITSEYKSKGLAGVMPLLETPIIRDIVARHAASSASRGGLPSKVWDSFKNMHDDILYILLAAFALLLVTEN